MSGSRSTSESLPHIQPKVTVNNAILYVHSNLQRADYGSFQQACAELRQSTYSEVTLDLTRCTYATSSFIGDLVEAVTQMKTEGKNVKVLVSPELGRLLHMAHLYHLIAYDIVDREIEAH